MVGDDWVARVEAQNLDSFIVQRIPLRALNGRHGIDDGVRIAGVIGGTGAFVTRAGIFLAAAWRTQWAMVGCEIKVQVKGLAGQFGKDQ